VNYVPIRDHLESTFGLPVLIGNDATLAGYGELCLGVERPVQNLIYLYSDIGMGLILDGHIYWGSGGSAGELGIFISSDDDCLTWLKGPLFVVPSSGDLGLISETKKLIQEGHPTRLQDLVQGNLEAINLDTIVRAAHEGDQLARDVIENAAMRLGIRIADLTNILNPEVIVLGGGIEKAGSLLLEPVWRAVKKYAFEEAGDLVEVVPAKLGENAVALGAACWVIREVFIQS
jgi:glucokinase